MLLICIQVKLQLIEKSLWIKTTTTNKTFEGKFSLEGNKYRIHYLILEKFKDKINKITKQNKYTKNQQNKTKEKSKKRANLGRLKFKTGNDHFHYFVNLLSYALENGPTSLKPVWIYVKFSRGYHHTEFQRFQLNSIPLRFLPSPHILCVALSTYNITTLQSLKSIGSKLAKKHNFHDFDLSVDHCDLESRSKSIKTCSEV